MALSGSSIGRARLPRLVALLLLLLLPVSLLAAQATVLEVSSQTPRVGDTIRVSITLNRLLGPELEIDEPEYPDLIQRVRGPIVESVVRRPFGPMEDITQVISFDFRCLDAGFAIFPAFEIRGENGVAETEPYLLSVGLAEGEWWVPPVPAWELSDPYLVIGQTALVNLNLTRSADFEFPDRIDIDSPENAVFEEVAGEGTVTEFEVMGQRLLSYPVATYLVTPTAEGTLEIPPAVTQLRGVPRETDPLSVPVRGVPEAAEASGAVGRFRVEASLSESEVLVGGHTTLSITIAGEGNLSYLEFPPVEAPGFVVADQVESFDAEPTRRGYRGSRSLEVRLQAMQAPDGSEIRLDSFVYYDPLSRTVRTVPPRAFDVDVFDVAQPVATPEAFPFSLLSAEQRQEVAPRNFYANPWFYLLLLPPVLLSILLPALRTSGIVAIFVLMAISPSVDAQIPGPEQERVLELYERGNLPEAYRELRLVAEDSQDPGTRYNLALLAYQMRNPGEAIYHLREAIRLQPGFTLARDALSYVEESEGLENQVPPANRIHPDRYLIGFVVLAYLLGFLALLPLRYRSGIYTVVFVLLVIGLLSSLAGMTLSILQRREPTVVVATETGELRRIPQDMAEPWIYLSEGTALIARDRHEDYFLVETGSEITGWIRSDQLLIDIGEQQ